MGDREEIIEYTPEESAEIERITGIISRMLDMPEETGEPVPPVKDKAAEEINLGEPEDLTLPSGDLEGIDFDLAEDMVSPEREGQDEFPVTEDLPEEPGFPGEKSEIQDITGLIQEVPAEEDIFPEQQGMPEDITAELEPVPGEGEPEALEELFEEVPEKGEEILPEFTEEEEAAVPGEELPETEPAEPGPVQKGSPLEQLEALTIDEPESLDVQDISEEGFVNEPEEEIPQAASADEFESEIMETADTGVTVGEGGAADIPDLSEMSIEEVEEIPEAGEAEIPDIDFDDIGIEMPGEETEEVPAAGPEPELPEEEYPALDRIDEITEEPEPSVFPEEISTDEYQAEEIEVPEELHEEEFSVELLDEDMDTGVAADAPPVKEEGIDLSARELRKLKKAILLFNPGLIQAIKKTIINDLLPVSETRKLVDMIISGKSEEAVRSFLEKKLDASIPLVDESARAGRKVITARPEYTREGRDRQRRLLKLTRIFGLALLAAFLLTILGYQYVYKPVMAKRTTGEGVALIMRSGDYIQKPKDYSRAEELFRHVHENYAENYIYAYNEYARAYFDRGEYNESLEKLNRAYEVAPDSTDTLNSLGYFYSRVPAEFFRSVRYRTGEWYYGEKKGEGKVRGQLDLAVDFYKRVLALDSDNITGLYGIGNAYFYQGRFLRAKKYYEDILKVDRDSVIGFSGLLNLYVERDAFEQVASIHTELRSREMMHEMPSALLAKLASYYMDKAGTGEENIRIRYGVQSPRFMDIDDNIYPAVSTVLKSLNMRDPDYPPLQYQFARFSRIRKNYPVMKRYLEKALKLSPNYYSALHLMGEYYYETREPVKAYEYLNRAVRAYGNQPEFTRDEFYRENENIGHTHAVLGNIFYYFFDRIKYRYGDLEDELLDADMDKMANYNIAREKYEKALGEKYESPEIHYNLGRIYYLNRLYKKSLEQWLYLYEDFVEKPELMMALGNAFYHIGNYEASRGEYLKLISIYENEADSIRVVDPVKQSHQKIYQSLASAYNNLGAVYQVRNDETRSSVSYWKAIDYAKRIDRENEFARVNLARSFKRERRAEPILDENIPYSVDIYREDMRK